MLSVFGVYFSSILSDLLALRECAHVIHRCSFAAKEFEPDGTPKKYPLHQPVWDHGYEWEHWAMMPAGCLATSSNSKSDAGHVFIGPWAYFVGCFAWFSTFSCQTRIGLVEPRAIS